VSRSAGLAQAANAPAVDARGATNS